jgi:hypothetical protein
VIGNDPEEISSLGLQCQVRELVVNQKQRNGSPSRRMASTATCKSPPLKRKVTRPISLKRLSRRDISAPAGRRPLMRLRWWGLWIHAAKKTDFKTPDLSEGKSLKVLHSGP